MCFFDFLLHDEFLCYLRKVAETRVHIVVVFIRI